MPTVPARDARDEAAAGEAAPLPAFSGCLHAMLIGAALWIAGIVLVWW